MSVLLSADSTQEIGASVPGNPLDPLIRDHDFLKHGPGTRSLQRKGLERLLAQVDWSVGVEHASQFEGLSNN